MTVPAASTGMARVGARRSHMVGVAVEWDEETGNGIGCKRILISAPTLLNIFIVMSAMRSSLRLNANEYGRTKMFVPSMPLPRP